MHETDEGEPDIPAWITDALRDLGGGGTTDEQMAAFREALRRHDEDPAEQARIAAIADDLEQDSWRIAGYDPFEGADYDLPGDYDDEAAAREAGFGLLRVLERTQPAASSGGQSPPGISIQDRVYVVRPDGTSYRLLPGSDDGRPGRDRDTGERHHDPVE